jgi:hypothetical protein
MRAAIQGGGWAVLAVAAQMLTSCGGDVGVHHPAKQGLGGWANGSGGTLSSDGGRLPDPSAGGGGGSAAGGAGLIAIDAGTLTGGRGGEGVEVLLQCSDYRNDAAPVTLSYVSEQPPMASGGTPVEGLYHLTRWELFTGTDGPGSGDIRTTAERIVITSVGDRTAEMAATMGQPEGEMGIVYQWNVRLTFDGSSFTSTPTCRTEVISVSEGTGRYTATVDQLVFMTQSGDGNGTWVRTYTLQ